MRGGCRCRYPRSPREGTGGLSAGPGLAWPGPPSQAPPTQPARPRRSSLRGRPLSHKINRGANPPLLPRAGGGSEMPGRCVLKRWRSSSGGGSSGSFPPSHLFRRRDRVARPWPGARQPRPRLWAAGGGRCCCCGRAVRTAPSRPPLPPLPPHVTAARPPPPRAVASATGSARPRRRAPGRPLRPLTAAPGGAGASAGPAGRAAAAGSGVRAGAGESPHLPSPDATPGVQRRGRAPRGERGACEGCGAVSQGWLPTAVSPCWSWSKAAKA